VSFSVCGDSCVCNTNRYDRHEQTLFKNKRMFTFARIVRSYPDNMKHYRSSSRQLRSDGQMSTIEQSIIAHRWFDWSGCSRLQSRTVDYYGRTKDDCVQYRKMASVNNRRIRTKTKMCCCRDSPDCRQK